MSRKQAKIEGLDSVVKQLDFCNANSIGGCDKCPEVIACNSLYTDLIDYYQHKQYVKGKEVAETRKT